MLELDAGKTDEMSSPAERNRGGLELGKPREELENDAFSTLNGLQLNTSLRNPNSSKPRFEATDADRAEYESLRLRQLTDAFERLSESLRPVKWSRGRIQEERQSRLRDLVRVEKEKSPWHTKRLANFDAESITEADLVKLPVMTKADLMTNFDRIVTDNRLTLEVVNAHVAALTKDKYLFDNYHVIASGGTSGFRGVFVCNWDEWITLTLTGREAFRVVNPVLLRLLSFGPVRRLLVRSGRSAKTKTQRKGGMAVVMAGSHPTWITPFSKPSSFGQYSTFPQAFQFLRSCKNETRCARHV